MKKKNAGILALFSLCVIIFAGCSGRNIKHDRHSESAGNDKLKVVTTIFPYYDYVRQIAGDRVDLRMVVPAGMDTHSFEPTAEDMVAVSEADIFIYNGGSMESWVGRVLSATDVSNLRVEAMMEQVDTLEEEQVEGMSGREGKAGHGHTVNDKNEDETGHSDIRKNADKSVSGHGGTRNDEDESKAENLDTEHDDADNGDAEMDEHIWTSPANAKLLVSYILSVLVEKDSSNGDFYKKNAAIYIEKLTELDKQISKVVSESKRKYLVFADRFPLRYFTEEYNLSYSAAFPGCSSDIEPSADTIAYLIDRVNDEDIPVVLKIELTSSRVADVIADATGTKVETFYTCHNVTSEQFTNGISYVELMEHNIDVLKKALH